MIMVILISLLFVKKSVIFHQLMKMMVINHHNKMIYINIVLIIHILLNHNRLGFSSILNSSYHCILQCSIF
eukprot:UN05554